ncbi:hypothetical protein E1295_14655 [Nonomuraea mesophila]|uniref:DUF3533 domain-containing protein n=1 Tax=Nonomuraea mesophila TaxID=2530382 RepID=A0A4R5FPQ2_9ACTN|nr:hypothetical protein [Nonomuraea mesophila]TDE54634.1 hypothetical protein E1295_14655 [Nonomuraea mesophila]
MLRHRGISVGSSSTYFNSNEKAMNQRQLPGGKTTALRTLSNSPTARPRRPATMDIGAGLVAALTAAVVAILTFGVQATVAPREVPLGIVISGPEPSRVTDQLAASSGETVLWHPLGSNEANDALAAGAIVGYLTVSIGVNGSVEATSTTSGQTHPNATVAAEQILRQAATGIVAATTPSAAPVAATVVHPVSPVGRIAPLALVSALWIGGMISTVVARLLRRRTGARAPEGGIGMVIAFGLAAPAALLATVGSWGDGVAWTAGAVAMTFLTATAFAAFHGALARLLGWASLPLIGLLYLIGAPMATQPPELLAPVYRLLAWSWSPLRITVDETRAQLFAPQQSTALAYGVLGTFLLAGLVVIALTRHSKIASR